MGPFHNDLERHFKRATAIGIACLVFMAVSAFLAGRYL